MSVLGLVWLAGRTRPRAREPADRLSRIVRRNQMIVNSLMMLWQLPLDLEPRPWPKVQDACWPIKSESFT